MPLAMSLLNLALLLAGAVSTVAQFVSPPTDLITKAGYAGYQVRYKEVPKGICELSNAKSYSGYVDVSSDQVGTPISPKRPWSLTAISTFSSGFSRLAMQILRKRR